MNKQHSRTS